MTMTGRRIGRFIVSGEAIDDNLAKYIYEGMIPLRVEYIYVTGNFDVMALSEKFDEIAHGYDPPWYDVFVEGDNVIDYDVDGNMIGGHSENLKARFERRDYILLAERGFLV